MKKKIYNKAIVLGGSKGLGRSIANELKKSCKNVIPLSSKDIDTSNIESVKEFIGKYKSTDILILNTGGPKPMPFNELSEKISKIDILKTYSSIIFTDISNIKSTILDHMVPQERTF